jgi:hypothetical protein
LLSSRKASLTDESEQKRGGTNECQRWEANPAATPEVKVLFHTNTHGAVQIALRWLALAGHRRQRRRHTARLEQFSWRDVDVRAINMSSRASRRSIVGHARPRRRALISAAFLTAAQLVASIGSSPATKPPVAFRPPEIDSVDRPPSRCVSSRLEATARADGRRFSSPLPKGAPPSGIFGGVWSDGG